MTDTDPQHWFLPALPFTEGNSVLALVDGAAYMAHLHERLQAMGDGDSLFFTAWRCTPDQKLRPELRSPDTRLQPLLLDLVQRRVVVRLLAWYVPLTKVAFWFDATEHNRENESLVRRVRRASIKAGLAGSAFLDDRLPIRISSHHQKSIVLTTRGDPWAYLGGIDIALDRWDTPAHNSPKARQREKLEAWHDLHCVLQGPAVAGIAENFRDRWNQRTPPVSSRPKDLPVPMANALPVPATARGTLAVQRLRTFACGGLYGFMPRGEQTARRGINQAIDRARYFVYLEDQYFWPSTTVDSLTQAVRRGVHVFLVLAKAFDMAGPLATGHYEMRQAALNQLRAAGADRVVCCHLEQAGRASQIYVHAKFMIVDDRYVTIGSTNVGRRSHTTDTELNVAMVDSALEDGTMAGQTQRVGRFARALRLQVWNEHLGVPADELTDPIAAKARWPLQRKGSKKIHHAVWHSGEPPSEPITLADWYRLLKALRELSRESRPWPDATAAELALVDTAVDALESLGQGFILTELSDLAVRLALGPLWWTPTLGLRDRLMKFVKDKLMNVETACAA